MAGTILPIVYGDRQSEKAPAALWFHLLGSILGAAALGGLLGTIGLALGWRALALKHGVIVLLVAGTVSLLYSTRELGLLAVPVVQCRRQVPQQWRVTMSPHLCSLLYGLGLGFGVGTRIAVSTFYPAAIWAMLVADPALSAIGMAAFGLGRVLPLLVLAGLLKNKDESILFTEALHDYKPLVHFVNGLVLSTAGACLIMLGWLSH